MCFGCALEVLPSNQHLCRLKCDRALVAHQHPEPFKVCPPLWKPYLRAAANSGPSNVLSQKCAQHVHRKSKKPQQILVVALEVPWMGLIGALKVPGMLSRDGLEGPQRCLVGASNLLERCLRGALKMA